MITIDGWITIGTKLNTDKFDKQISDLENKIDSEEKKQEFLNNKTRQYKAELKEVNKEVKNLGNEWDYASNQAKKLEKALDVAKKNPLMNTSFMRQDYEKQVQKVAELEAQLSKAEKKQNDLTNKVKQTKLQYDKSVKSADRLRGKIETITLTKQNKDIKSMTDGIGSAIKKVGKLALAVISVRSAYSLLRQASSTWGQYNEQYARDLEYIRFALAYGLAPILEKIVQLVSTLMTYVNYLANAWFGKTIFASAKDFEKMSKSAGGVAKATKEIKNNIASFDELSILSKSSSDGAGSGFLAPSFDLGNFETEIPEWIKWLGDNGETVKNSLIGIGTALGALKLADLAKNLGLVGGKLSLIKGIGIGVAVKGFADGVKDLQKYAEDPSLQNLGTTLSDIGESVVGVGLAMGNLPVVAGGGLVWLTGKFVENWDEIRDTTQQGIDYLRNKSPEIERIFGETGRQIYEDVLDDSQDILNTVDTSLNSFNNIVYDYIGMMNALRDGEWTTAWTKFKDIFVNIWDGISSIFQTKINSIIRFLNTFIESAETYINNLIDGLNSLGASIQHVNIGRIPLLGQQNVASMPSMTDLGISGPVKTQTTFSEDVSNLASSIADTVSNVKQDITVKFEGTMAQFVRELKPKIEIEDNRIGPKIIKGGAH